LISLYIAIFLVALDRTIIGPAIPEITNKFRSIDDIGWYGSAYMLTSCGFILIYGRIYTFFSTKKVFLTSIILFEIGSAICGAAPSSLILIIGRAVAGFGSSGIFTGAILIILEIVPLHRRPMLQGLFGACFGVASVAGPLLGGAFTGSKATWRWCFYINLPLGAITIAVVLFFLELKDEKERPGNWMETLKKMDPIGTLLFLPAITCLLLALEWGASESWHEPKIIALLTVFAVLFVAFIGWQAVTRNTTATVPARIAFQRSVAFGGLSQFAVGATMLTVSLYIPLWFQAIKNVSAMQSGVRTIPLVLSVVVGSIMSGALVQKIGYYTPFMIIGSVLMATGAGLLTTWGVSVSSAQWISYQVILGLGVGYTMQHPNLAIQIVLPKPDIPTGTAILSLCQTLGGAVFTAVGQNTFIDKFGDGLRSIPGINVGSVTAAGATSLREHVPAQLLDRVIAAYSNSLTQGPFFACMIVACLTLPAALGMQWKSVKQQMPPGPPQRHPSKRAVPRDEESFGQMQTPIDGSHSAWEKEDDEFDANSLNLPEPRYQNFRSSYRMVGDYSWVLVKRLNPDLGDGDLSAPAPHR
jgi:EmrB/QacA subfamily drug resistance transporter